jgi:hypothetical protein
MAASLAWGGMRNGFIPASALRAIGRGFLLEATAAIQFLAARAFLLSVYGIDILDYVSETYRDWDGQVYQKRRWTLLGKPWNAATPGDSIHGWAKAIDFDADALERDGIYGLVMAVLARYGFIRDFLDIGETWHTSFREASVTVTASSDFTPLKKGLFMALTEDEERRILNTSDNLDRFLLQARGPYAGSTVDMILSLWDRSNNQEQDRVEVRDNVRKAVYMLIDAQQSDQIAAAAVAQLAGRETIDIGELSAAIVKEIAAIVESRPVDVPQSALEGTKPSTASLTA